MFRNLMLVVVLGSSCLAPVASAEEGKSKCLSIESLFKEIMVSVASGNKFIQGHEDFEILEGKDRVTDAWLLDKENELISADPSPTPALESEIKQIGCERVTGLVEDKGSKNTHDLIIKSFTRDEIVMGMDWGKIYDDANAISDRPSARPRQIPAPKTREVALGETFDAVGESLAESVGEALAQTFADALRNTLESPEARVVFADMVKEQRDGFIRGNEESFRWTVRRDNVGQATSSFRRVFEDAKVGKVVVVSTELLRWGPNPEPVQPSARVLELQQSIAAAKRNK